MRNELLGYGYDPRLLGKSKSKKKRKWGMAIANIATGGAAEMFRKKSKIGRIARGFVTGGMSEVGRAGRLAMKKRLSHMSRAQKIALRQKLLKRGAGAVVSSVLLPGAGTMIAAIKGVIKRKRLQRRKALSRNPGVRAAAIPGMTTAALPYAFAPAASTAGALAPSPAPYTTYHAPDSLPGAFEPVEPSVDPDQAANEMEEENAENEAVSEAEEESMEGWN